MSLESDIASLVKSVGLELYDTSIVSENDETIYRVSVISPNIVDGKKEGVSMDACVELTHLISPLLDVTPPVGGEYRLEVGSPGIERKLSKLEHYKLSLGELVSLVLLSKEKYKGKLLRVEGSIIVLDVEGEEIEIDLGQISKARTYFEW
ncbi:MAG: ribosome maturation factor [Sulfurimonas sp.]|jgi:ribosome maturation factor RimP|nr:ribosome maturation factor [Sulfurimonas sp.]